MPARNGFGLSATYYVAPLGLGLQRWLASQRDSARLAAGQAELVRLGQILSAPASPDIDLALALILNSSLSWPTPADRPLKGAQLQACAISRLLCRLAGSATGTDRAAECARVGQVNGPNSAS